MPKIDSGIGIGIKWWSNSANKLIVLYSTNRLNINSYRGL